MLDVCTVYLKGWVMAQRWPQAWWSSRSRCGSRGTRRQSAAAGSTADGGGHAPSHPAGGGGLTRQV